MERARRLDVPCDERRQTRTRRTLRLNVEPQLRRPSGPRRPHASRLPRHGGGGGDCWTFRRCKRDELGETPMDKFDKLTGVAAPLPMINIDTDMIIPKQFLKTIKRTGLGKNLFDEMRFDDKGNEKPDFVLNKPAYRYAEILVTGDNFGCGSSRE